MAQTDSDGALFDGPALNRLRVPADVPARDFWSLIACSKDTKAFISNDEDRVGLSSYGLPEMQTGADGNALATSRRGPSNGP